MADLDVFPVTVRGPLSTTSSRLVTFARMFTFEGRFYVAESRKRGHGQVKVTEYPMPEGEPYRDGRRTKAGEWGDWSWNGCGCASGWSKYRPEDLAAKAEPLVPVSPGPDDPAELPSGTSGSDSDEG